MGTSYRHVLLPLDGSDFAAAAVWTARALAERFDAELVMMTVAADEDDGARLQLESAAALGAAGDDDAMQDQPIDIVIGDDPAEAIVGRSAELDSCVVCMSTNGRGRVAGSLLGSVARTVLQTCRRPMVTVGPNADRPPGLTGRPRRRPSSWAEPLSAPRIVACVDGTPESETVLPTAMQWATALHMQLAIITIAEDAPATVSGERSNRFGPPDPEPYVARLVEECTSADAEVTGRVLYDPIGAASGLRTHLQVDPAGLVALTAHGRTGYERMRLGATAADIVRSSPAPALVVPLPDT